MSSDTLVDAITNNNNTTLACPAPGALMGTTGFQSCVTGTKVNLLLRSHISQIEIHRLSSTATSRVGNLQPAPDLSGIRSVGTDTMNLSWTWSGPSTGVTFTVSQVVNGGKTQVYSGGNASTSASMSGSTGQNHCYTVTATTGSVTSPPSNAVCKVK